MRHGAGCVGLRARCAVPSSTSYPAPRTRPVLLSDDLPQTPDGRYFVTGGRLWRRSNPALPEDERERLVRELMDARRAVGAATRARDADAEHAARARVDAAKVALGERGPTWWDGEDVNRHAPQNTAYAAWWDGLTDAERAAGTARR